MKARGDSRPLLDEGKEPCQNLFHDEIGHSLDEPRLAGL
jgi:hypothetical protein